jgi:uncharacterized membrane protein YphA (DoxX/SURF4 family)
MSNQTYLTIGRIFFALGVIAIGIICIADKDFSGLLQVPVTLPAYTVLAYITGALLVTAGLLILSGIYAYGGAMLVSAIWIISIAALYIPLVIMNYKNGNDWAGTFEVDMLLAGSLILVANFSRGKKWAKLIMVAGYLFALALVVFCIQHFMYAVYLAAVITAWIPFKLFWAYFVGVAFAAVAISIVINKLVRLATAMLGLMFFLWVCVLHAPLVIQHLHMADVEAEITSLFVALAVSGVSFLIAGSQVKKA